MAVAGCIAVVSSRAADSYSMGATITLHKETKQYEVFAQVCKLVDRRSGQTEEVIARPRTDSALGAPATFYVGSSPSEPAYRKSENVTMDVDWPKEGENNSATCTIVVKRGNKLVAKSKLQVSVQEK